MFKGIIFDFDGTLADTMPIALEAFRRALEPVHGRLLQNEEIRAAFGPTEAGTMPTLAPNAQESTLADYHRHYEELHSGLTSPFEGIRELLSDLRAKGVLLGIVTGKGEDSLHFSLAHIGLAHAFDKIEVGCIEGPCKPQGIRKLMKEWAFERSELLYVGDAPSDVPAAREAGVRIAAVAWADPLSVDELKAMNPDWVFKTVSSFRDWLLSTSLPESQT